MTDTLQPLLQRFDEVWLHDFEFSSQPDLRPDVVCLAAIELRSGRTLRLWRDQLTDTPPYRTDDRVLFVNFIANAELTCHLALGWPVPRHVLDLSPAFRNIVSGRHTPEGKGLLGALAYYGFTNLDQKRKDAMRKRIMQGWPFTAEEQKQIQDYCHGDVEDLLKLLPKVLAEPEFNLNIALYHGEFVAMLAAAEHAGVPIDRDIFPSLADEHAWREIRDAMVPAVNAQYGVYVCDVHGRWSFSMAQFEAYLERDGLLAGWPRTDTGRLNMKDRVWEEATKGWPQLQQLRELRHTQNKMRRVKLAVGADFRNRTTLWTFKSKTSRTQPAAREWIFSPATWLRSLIKPEPGTAIAYIDYSSMEFLLAASFSDGHLGPVNRMMEMYLSGDPYLSYAKAIGAIPAHITKKSPEWASKYHAIRYRYKVMLLAVQYGMSAPTLAARLKVSVFEAAKMLTRHREQFRQYWAWSDDYIQHAMQTGVMRTAFGWHCRVGITEFNERSMRNWPIQATGAEIFRIACILGARHGIKIIAPNHDAVLIEAPLGRIDADIVLMRECMRRASRIVLNRDQNSTHELRTDYVKVPSKEYPERYMDERGAKFWAHVMQFLAEYQKKKDAA